MENEGKIETYEFKPDVEWVGDVSFAMNLRNNVDPNRVREALSESGLNVSLANYLDNSGVLMCTADRKTYQTLCAVRLEQDPAKAFQQGFTDEGYKQALDSNVPGFLENLVRSVHLNVMAVTSLDESRK